MTGLTDLDKWQSVVIHDDRPHRLRQMATPQPSYL